MEIVNHIIEWVGVLFLSIEAIKLENLKKLIPILHNIRIALNSPYAENEQGRPMRIGVAKGYEGLRKFSELIIYAIGLIFIMLLLFSTHLLSLTSDLLMKYIMIFSDVPYYRIILDVWLTIIILFGLPYYVGNEFVIYFSIFADKYYRLMAVLEKNTFNGVIGIIGFLLVTIYTIISIAGY